MDSHLPEHIQQAAAEACAGGVAALSIKKHSEVTPMDSIIERQREIVARHIRAENEHDWTAVYDTFVQDDRAHYDVMPLGAVFKGMEGVRGFYQSIAAALPDLQIKVLSEYDVRGCSIREVVISGTHQSEFAGVKPLGNAIRIEMAAFYSTLLLGSSFQSESTTIKRALCGRCRPNKNRQGCSRTAKIVR